MFFLYYKVRRCVLAPSPPLINAGKTSYCFATYLSILLKNSWCFFLYTVKFNKLTCSLKRGQMENKCYASSICKTNLQIVCSFYNIILSCNINLLSFLIEFSSIQWYFNSLKINCISAVSIFIKHMPLLDRL